jgi:uncharacterized damage-inducible protein DinB
MHAMTILDRLVAHDAWTTRQLLLRCRELTDEQLDRPFDIGQGTLRNTFLHLIGNMEAWTDLMLARPAKMEARPRQDETVDGLLERLTAVAKEFAELAARVERERSADEMFLDTDDDPPQKKSLGGGIGHLITHSMHHRAQALYLMERLGLEDLPEGDLLGWEHVARGWR